MNIFKTKKFILTTLIFVLITTLSFAMLHVFRNENVQVYALNGVESVSMSSFTQPDTTKDVYTCSLSSGISEKTATLTLIIKDAGTLKIAYTNSAGSLTITNTAAGFSYTASGNTTTAVTLDIGLASGDNTIVFTCKSKSWWGANGVAQIELLSIDRTQGISGTTITEGFGTTDNPYIIDEQADFAVMNQALSAVYELGNNITLSGNFTPIGSSTAAFSGTFLGNGHTISNMTISGGTYRGMFAQTNGGTIKDLTLNNFNITGASTYSAMLIGYAVNGTVVENVNLYGKVSAVAGDVGGVVGYANGTDAVKVKNCNVYGSVSTTATWNIGGLSGAGGTFENCVVYANVSGVQLVGGITGGYKDDIGDLEKLSGAQFGSYTNCYVAGDVAITGIHNNNYPYWGIVNGYGAYCKYTLSNVGQRISFTYTTSVDVEEIRVFNSNVNPDGLVVSPTSTGEGYSFTQDVTLTNTYAGGSSNASSLSSETAVTGITGNYGGLTIRFKMADGKYKYISTLNKAESKFQSVFDVNLDNLTSYVDNFSSIEIDTSVGTGSYTTSDSISVWGTAKVANANDFEHLSWIINGAIPTTFANGVYYNARSVATLSISLQADIDLTTLNPTNHNFYGLGKTEMYPYRGSIYGNGHSLTVNMNFPNAYLMGIICVSTDQENQIVVENLTINGTIAGRYRVGIVGMNDNYTRTCSVAFTNVTNNANITALSQVGAFVGEAQGGGGSFGTKENAKIYLINCVNNGNITATAGDAGGLVGTLNHIHNAATYAVVTLKNCANNGNVSATGYAGGFVAGISNTVTIEGTNINSGVVISSSGKANFYVANIGSGSFSTTDGLQTIYKINLGVAGASWTLSSCGASLYNSGNEIVTSATYTANDFGIISVKFANLQTFSGVSLSLNVPLLKESITITPAASNTDEFYNDVDYKKTMATSVIVPIDIQMWDEDHNVYNITSSTENWVLKADVTFNRNLSETNSNVETIDLVPYVGDAKLDTLLDSNQLVFVAVTFDHATYNIPETFSQYLYRITEDVENYVIYANDLISKTSGTNDEFKTLGLKAKNAYDSLYTEMSGYSSENLTRFENYIANSIQNIKKIDAINDKLKIYYENIANSIVGETTETLDYGNYTFNKTITFTMLSGDVITKDLTYSFEKADISEELKATAKTTGVSFKVGEVVTCSYAEDVNVAVNPIGILNVEFEDAEFVYDNTQKTIEATLTLLAGDNLNYTLSYNDQVSVENVGEYEVKLSSISGSDAKFYNIPETYSKGKLTINPVKYTINVNSTELIYNKQAQAYSFTLEQSTSNYEYIETDYKTTYTGVLKSGDEYTESEIKPTEAGNYIAKIILLNSNLEFANANENTLTFEIKQKQLESFSFDTILEYNGAEQTFLFEFEDLIEGDELNILYDVYSTEGVKTSAKNADDYTLKITSVGNSNYCFKTLSKSFVINKEKLTITLRNQKSTYGDSVIVSQSEFELTSGTIYSEDDLGLKLITNATSTSSVDEDYAITAINNNSNYDVTFVNGKYTITQREATISFGTQTEYVYNSEDFYSQIKPTLGNILEKDLSSFICELSNENGVTTEFKNAGTYTLKLVENEETNEVLKNYLIAKKEETYKIIPKVITLKPNYMQKNYTQAILNTDFSLAIVELAGSDELKDIVEYKYIVCLKDGEELIDYTNLDVDEYTIKLVITNTNLTLYNNYDITLETNILEIVQRETYIDAKYVSEKIYDAEEIDFSAKLVDAYHNEISGATINVEIKKDGEITETIKDVGVYAVIVTGTAGENNKVAIQEYTIIIKTNYITITLNNTNQTYNGKDYVPDYTINHSETGDDVYALLKANVLDSNKQSIAAKNVGDYYVEFAIDDENYTIQKSLFDVSIAPIELTLTIEEQTYTFGDGFNIQNTKYSLNKELIKGDLLDLTFSSENLDTIVGDYDVTATNSNINYKVTVVNAKLHITKRTLTLNYSGENSLTYNETGYTTMLSVQVSNAISDDVYSVFYLNADNEQIQSIVDAGEYSLVVKLNDTHNYQFESSEESVITQAIVITKKTMELEIEISSKVYDGNAIEYKVYFGNSLLDSNLYTVEFYQGETKLTQTPKDAQNYTIKIVETISKNYKFSNNTKDFEISLREVNIDDISKEFNYTRATIKPTLTLNNVVANEDIKLDYVYVETVGMFREVGNYTIKINGLTGTVASNYKLVSENTITYSIVPIQVEVKIENTEFVFTNKQLTKQELGISFVSELNILESDYSLPELPTNVGNYNITFESQNTGIEFSVNSFNLKITKADIEGIAFANKTVNYNNQSHGISVDKTTLSNGIKLNVEYSGNMFIDAGVYEITATLTNDNYNTLVLNATLTINQVTEQVQVSKTVNFTYNAQAQGVEILGLDKAWYNQLISFSYVGENYSSIVKPINAGTYKLIIKSNNENNLKITNSENEFVINTKAITIQSLQTQTTTYNAQMQEYNVATLGVIAGESVAVNVNYNGEFDLPKDAGTYQVEFVGLSGTNAHNYHIENATATSTFVINPYQINVKAENKTIVYGEKDVPLTYIADSLLGNDLFSGSLAREKEDLKTIGDYFINQGTLSAGNNYKINFVQGKYYITQRQLYFEDFQKEFTYNGTSQIPNVTFTNIVNGDTNVAKVNTIGNTTNAGTYKLQFVILNTNYKLPEISTFDITINKLDATDKIICLITTEKDYNGESFEPMVMIDGDYDYTLSYTINGDNIEEMVDAGTYLVTIELNTQNFKGTKSFEFTINKIDYDRSVLENIAVAISSNSFILSGINNISVSVDNTNFAENKIENLDSKTKYDVYVKVKEDKNHKTTSFLLGEFSTCASAEVLNEQISEIINEQIVLTDINDIKELLKDCENLSESEQAILNDENYINLINQYENYFNNIEEDIEEVKIVSDIVDFGETGRIRKISTIFSVLGLGIVLIKKGKKKDEFND